MPFRSLVAIWLAFKALDFAKASLHAAGWSRVIWDMPCELPQSNAFGAGEQAFEVAICGLLELGPIPHWPAHIRIVTAVQCHFA